MKNNSTNLKVFLHFTAAIALPLIIIILIMTDLPKAECLDTLDSTTCLSGSSRNSSGCNIVINDEAEFVMDQSEIARRILASTSPISYDIIRKQGQGFCDTNNYGSCIGPESKNYKQRACGYKEQCKF